MSSKKASRLNLVLRESKNLFLYVRNFLGKNSEDTAVYFLTPKSKTNSFTSSNLTPIKSSKSDTNMIQESPEVDPIYFKEFNEWLSSSIPLTEDTESPFVKRLLFEDVLPCLSFVNDELATKILNAIKCNTLEMEPYLNENVKRCELTQIEKVCHYQLRTDSNNEWVFISLQARNRVSLSLIKLRF